MPLPKPNSGEDRDKFLSRCMANPTMQEEYPDSKQRYAVCVNQYKNPKKKKEKIAKVEAQAFLDLEEALTRKLLWLWNRTGKKEVLKAIKLINNQQYEQARDIIYALNLEDELRKARKFFDLVGSSAMLFGASRLTEDPDKAALFRGDNKKGFDNATNNSFRVIASRLNASLVEATEKVITEKQARVISSGGGFGGPGGGAGGVPPTGIPERRIVKPFVSFADDVMKRATFDSIRLSSSLHTSRLSVYGYTLEAKALDVTIYKINEVLDARTCPICETMNGKVFRVVDLESSINEVINTDDPEKLKTLQPWPKQDKQSVENFRALTDDELVGNNWHFPPYHPLCRGYVDASKG